jgi:Tol biopolymer transport system component
MDDSNRHGSSTMVGPSVAPTLEIVRGNEQGKTTRLKLKTRIGRERDNDLVLTDPRVSRYHALIELAGGKWSIQDMGSANGTLVNGQPVSEGHVLQTDDRITLGDTELVFQPSRVGGTATAAERTLQPPAPAGPPRVESPRWKWGWIAGGVALLLILIAVAALALLGLGGKAGQTAEATTAPFSGQTGDFALAYEDDFSDPSSGWDDAFDRYTTKQYGNNKYYIEVTTSNLVAWGLANRDVSDFRLEVDAAQEAGPNNNGYGVLFRFQDRNNFYRFDISGDGFFLLSKFRNGEWVTLVPWTASSAINVGGAANNRLGVEAIGSRIRIYANEKLLADVKDDAFTHGNFGFFASTFSDPNLTISYDDIKLWTPRGEELAVIPTVTPTRFAPEPEGTAEVIVPTDTPPATSQSQPAVEVTQTPTAPAEATATPLPTSTPIPLPAYTSRDLPAARNAVALKGRLVFPVFDPASGTYNIYSAKPDGSDRKLVVAAASQPALNADGKRIAFRSWQADSRGLFERGVEGGDVWKFDTFVEAARPAFAPDGQSLLFLSREGGNEPAIYHTVGADHQVLRRDGSPIQGESPAWTPDGKQFIYKGCLGANCGLILSGIDGSFPKQLTQDLSDTNPAVSPDGKTIAFMSRRSGSWEVYVAGIDGAGLAQLTTDAASDGLPAWSPDGKTIAFVSERDGTWAIWAMSPDGKNQRRLFELGGSIDGQVRLDIKNSRGWLEEHLAWGP